MRCGVLRHPDRLVLSTELQASDRSARNPFALSSGKTLRSLYRTATGPKLCAEFGRLSSGNCGKAVKVRACAYVPYSDHRRAERKIRPTELFLTQRRPNDVYKREDMTGMGREEGKERPYLRGWIIMRGGGWMRRSLPPSTARFPCFEATASSRSKAHHRVWRIGEKKRVCVELGGDAW